MGAGGKLPSLQNEEKDVWQCKSQGPQELLFVDRRKGRHDDDDQEEFEVLSQEVSIIKNFFLNSKQVSRFGIR